MAVDSRDKRAAATSLPFLLSAYPLADGAALTQADRQHVCWVYRGIAAIINTVTGGAGDFIPIYRRRRLLMRGLRR